MSSPRSFVGWLLAVAITAAGCSGERSAAPQASSSPGGTVVAGKAYGPADIKSCADAKQTVPIGAAFELSGALVGFGQPSLDGVQLAVNELNAKGGFDVAGTCTKLELITQDNRSDAAATTAVMQGLMRDNGVRFVFGPTSGLTAQKAQEITQASSPPAIHFSAGVLWESTGLMGRADKRGLFRSALAQDLTSSAFLTGLKQALPSVKTITFLWRDDDISTATVGQYLIPQAKAMGYQVIADERYPVGTTDFASILTKIKQNKPDLLFTGYVPGENTAITKQVVELQAAGAMLGWQGATSIPLKDATGTAIPIPYVSGYQAPDPAAAQLPSLAAYVDKYQKQLKKNIGSTTYVSLWYYDEVSMLVKAMQLAGSVTDLLAVQKNLAALRWEGALGPVCWTAKQIVVYGTDVALVKDGQVKFMHIPPDLTKCAS